MKAPKKKLPRSMRNLLKIFKIGRKIEDSENGLANRKAQHAKAKAARRKASKVARASRKKNRGEASIQAWQLLQILFIGLKLAGVITWSWWAVMAPLMIVCTLGALVAVGLSVYVRRVLSGK